MKYNRITLTSSGGTITAETLINGYEDVEMYTASPITLSASVSIDVSDIYPSAVFNIRWNAAVSLNTFLVTICGETINQDALNQTGTFTCVNDGTSWTVQYFADGTQQPQNAQSAAVITVPVGGTATLVAGVDSQYQRLVGSPTTLSSNYTVTAATAGVKANSRFFVEIAGSVTIGTNTFTVFGVSINAAQVLAGGVMVIATFDGSVWRGVATSQTSIADINPIAALSVIANATNATASPTVVSFPTDGYVLKRSGLTLTTGLITAANLDSTIGVVQVAKVAITSAQILASYTTPIKVLDAPGAGYVNVVSKVLIQCTFNTTAYTTNLSANIVSFSGTDKLLVATGVWGFAASGIDQFFDFNPGASSSQYVANDVLRLHSSVGNPAAGDGSAIVYVIYTKMAL